MKSSFYPPPVGLLLCSWRSRYSEMFFSSSATCPAAFGLYLGIFLGKGGVKYGMFPTAVLRLLAFLKRNANTNPWPIRENLCTFPTFLPSFLARVLISCFRKTAFTSSPFPCNLLMLSELRVKVPFFVVFWQLLDI